MRDWRERGVLGKLHNIVTFIRRTPQRMAAFRAVQTAENGEHVHALMVCADNETRWNSTFAMIERAKRVSTNLDFFVSRNAELQDDALTGADWEFLGALCHILQPLKDLTKLLEGKAENGLGGSIGEVLPALDLIKQHLETERAKHDDIATPGLVLAHQWAVNAIDNGLDHLEKYHTIIFRIPAYQAATALDSRVKWGHFERNYTPQSVAETKRIVRHLWETEYKKTTPPSSSQDNSSPRTIASGRQSNILLDFMLHGSQGTPANEPPRGRTRRAPPDELDRWMAEPVEPLVTDIIAFWKAKKGAYPQLSQMALELYSIPAMSAEVERIFSSAKLLLTDQRASLKEDAIEANECLRQWDKEGFLRWQ
jgi:hypothetical protein